jgi:DNA-binding MarR family transcriptional regulator
MSYHIGEHHMIKNNEKKHNLGKNQYEILKFLAENGAHSIYATNNKLHSFSHYHATHTAFKSLENKGLIQKLENSKFWLTSKGIFTALTDENVTLKPLVRNIEKYKHKDLSKLTPVIDMLEKTPILRSMVRPILPLFEKYGSELEHKLSQEEMETVYKAFEGSPLKEVFDAFLKLREEISEEG